IKNDIANDPAYAAAVVSFLEGRLVDQLYPFHFKALVCPGVILHITPTARYEGLRWGFDAGLDFYLQTKESLHNIAWCKTDGRPPNIDIDKALKPSAFQAKVLGGFQYRAQRSCHDWVLSLQTDYSFI